MRWLGLWLLVLAGSFVAVAEEVFPDPSGHAYFPKGQESFFTSYLSAMTEPSIMEGEKSSFVLRFTWLRSFHDPIAIRVWCDGCEYRVHSVRLKLLRDGTPGPKIKDKTRSLKKSEMQRIRQLIARKDFWGPLSETDETLAEGANDGAAWIFETLGHRGYRMLSLWSPSYFIKTKAEFGLPEDRDYQVYVRLGEYLLKLTDLMPNDKMEFY